MIPSLYIYSKLNIYLTKYSKIVLTKIANMHYGMCPSANKDDASGHFMKVYVVIKRQNFTKSEITSP